jgi:hypothetical protein
MLINTIYVHGNSQLRSQIDEELHNYFSDDVRITRHGNTFKVVLEHPYRLNLVREMKEEMWALSDLTDELVDHDTVHWRLPSAHEEEMEEMQLGGGPREDRIMNEQLDKYETFIHRGKKNPQYGSALDELQSLRREIAFNENIQVVLHKIIDFFNMLQEHGFPVGNSHYPGPGKEWKEVVDQYLK